MNLHTKVCTNLVVVFRLFLCHQNSGGDSFTLCMTSFFLLSVSHSSILLLTPMRRRVQYNTTSPHLQVPNNFTIIFIVQGMGKLKNVSIFMKATFYLSVVLLYSWVIYRTCSPWVRKDSLPKNENYGLFRLLLVPFHSCIAFLSSCRRYFK